ncbi:MAG: AAA domain-containing protein [Pseudobdellovibrio sp.]|nr:AAA domain-containing protein [Pseudobdellovibrio sp.]
MSSQNYLQRQLTRYKDLLANLSKRNREIYYKESKSSSINLSKQPFQKNMFTKESDINFVPFRTADKAFDRILKHAEFNLSDHFQLDAIKDKEALNRLSTRLDKIRLTDDRHQREYGISGAWILGPFLCWRSSPQAPKDDLMISPIFKVPVDLKRNKHKKIVLEAEEDFLTYNPSLLLALKQHLGITIAENSQFESAEEGINTLLENLKAAQKKVLIPGIPPDAVPKIPARIKIVKDEDGNETRVPVKMEDVLSNWELEIYNKVTSTDFLLLDVIYLDQLNASRMVLFNDYDGIIENGLDHPILNELFNGTPISDSSPTDRTKLRELDSYKERDNHFVVDIDSTQHRAIDKATKSKAIVIQGPPGTGKSQTIVNLIADFLAKGKKVLFVSEKRPALDVVYNRMCSANIESQAVLIHSSDLNKNDLYQNFLELANSEPNSTDEKEWETVSTGLDLLKKDINQYADILQESHKASELNYVDLMVLAANNAKEKIDLISFNKFKNVPYDKIYKMKNEFNDIQSLIEQYPNLPNSPWRSRKTNTVRSIALEQFLQKNITQIIETENEFLNLNSKYLALTGEQFTEHRSTFWSNLEAPVIINSKFKNIWSYPGSNLKESLIQLKNILVSERDLLNRNKSRYYSVSPRVDSFEVEKLALYYSTPRGFIDWFSSAYWDYRKLRISACTVWDGTNKQFEGYQNYEASFNKLSFNLKPIIENFEFDIRKHDHTIASLEEILKTIDDLVSSFILSEKYLPVKFTKMMSESLEAYNETVGFILETKKCVEAITHLKSRIDLKLPQLKTYIRDIPDINTLTEAKELFNGLISNINELEAFDQLDQLISKTSERFEISELRDIIFSHYQNMAGRWSEVIESSVLLGWVDEVLTSSPVLRSFNRLRLAEQVRELKTALEQHQNTSRQAVHQAFAKRWTSSPRDEEALGLLKKEANKQRRILSPREIMEKGALKTMLDLKPCWLMSPLSISQILPLQNGLFDVIIFDEASQVRVEDAVPSIFRASTMIVVGDPKQMPPTSFFSGTVAEEEEEDEPISPSVLDLASQVYPSVLLEWHYRSKSESLIAFSNRAYYGGRLIAAPNPQVLTSNGALHFKQVSEAYFEGKEGNKIEAEAVIDHLIQLIREDSNRSYGVIAMGQVQANTLDEVLNEKMSGSQEVRNLIEKAMSLKDGEADVGLFIKNLENVQGDERDVILISVGYAAPAPGKKLRMNFGPLGKQGGGRRLNVAITRAKSKMFIYTSFAPAEMKTDEEAFAHNPDLCVFGRFLKFSEAVSSGNLTIAQNILNSFPMAGAITSRKSSRFALDVKRRLEEKGYKVTAEIGSNGFFIDLGIHHPVVESNFLLGIECDGAIFHSTPYARDRDKIREHLLISRGWKIERVWSQDWSKDWRKEVDRLDEKIKKILAS